VSVTFPLDDALIQMDARVPFIVIGRRCCRSSILVTILLSGSTVMLLSPYSFENFPVVRVRVRQLTFRISCS